MQINIPDSWTFWLGAIWLASYIVSQVNARMLVNSLKPYFTGEEFKKVRNAYFMKEDGGIQFFVHIVNFIIAPFAFLFVVLMPWNVRVESTKKYLSTKLPEFKTELESWATAAISGVSPDIED